jgi:hypothetical protein
MSDIKIGQFQLGEFATLAEQVAKQKRLDAETTARMTAEAVQLTAGLAEALFAPYVGKQICADGRYKFTLLRHKHYSGPTEHLFAFDTTRPGYTGSPGTPPSTYHTKGWTVHVEWNAKEQRMRATLTQQRDGGSGSPPSTDGGDGDIGTQAVRLARALAEQVGALLILEDK